MKILMLGKNGQVGWELQRSLSPLGQVVALDLIGDKDLIGNLADCEGLVHTLCELEPSVVVNAAAYAAVDKAENEPVLAMRINAEAPQVLAKTMLRLAAECEPLNVVDDQLGLLVGAELLTNITAHTIRTAKAKPEVSGVYHLDAAGAVSWRVYASFVIGQAGGAGRNQSVQSIESITTSVYPIPAQLPYNSRLDCRRLRDTFDLQIPDWQRGVARTLLEVQGY